MLPVSEDGDAVLRRIDRQIELHRDEPGRRIALLLERAAIRGRLEDYVDAVDRSAAWVEAAPDDPSAWRVRVQTLARVHRFADARAALEHLEPLVRDPSEWQPLATTIDEATGHLDRSAPARRADARAWPSTQHLVQWAGSLALAGKLDEALAVMPRAAAALHDNSPELLAWLLFQWGRLYEQKGEPAAARQFFEAAHSRMPGSVEVIDHLARAQLATGDPDAARHLVERALADNRHPSLLGLAAQLAGPPRRGPLLDEARAAWERYVEALPAAFSDHAARFYLGAGADPARAVALARANLATRDTGEARALAVEALLAAGNVADACEVAGPLVQAAATHAQRFVAWRALAGCGKRQEADRLAAELGIVP